LTGAPQLFLFNLRGTLRPNTTFKVGMYPGFVWDCRAKTQLVVGEEYADEVAILFGPAFP